MGSGADGVLPGEAGVAGETGIGADEGGAVLDGKGGEPGVVEVVAGDREVGDEFSEDAAMGFTGSESERAGIGPKLVGPEAQDLSDVQQEDFRMRGDAQEGGFGQFGEADFVPGLHAIQQPLAARLVIGGVFSQCVDEHIGVRQVKSAHVDGGRPSLWRSWASCSSSAMRCISSSVGQGPGLERTRNV